jgi:hypothetical protein
MGNRPEGLIRNVEEEEEEEEEEKDSCQQSHHIRSYIASAVETAKSQNPVIKNQ